MHYLVGTFDPTAQANRDEQARAVCVHEGMRLQIAGPLSLGEDAGGDPDLYAEQAQCAALDKPYRQRVCRLTVRENRVWPENWRITNGARLAGGADDPAKFPGLRVSDLVHESGCDVPLERRGDRRSGAIPGKTCRSTWNGSAYVISELTVSAEGQDALDRGFNALDAQTFGPRNGEACQFRLRLVTR